MRQPRPNNVLKYENWEGIFAHHHHIDDYGRKEPRDLFGLYNTIGRYLFFPSIKDWKLILLTLNAIYISLQAYLNYRQYRALQKATRPKILQNVISTLEFEGRRKHQILSTRVKIIALLWQFICIYIVTTSNLLPLIWKQAHVFKTQNISLARVQSYIQNFEHDPQLPLFYLASASLWAIIFQTPTLYVQTCIIGSGPPKHLKNTLSELGLVIASAHLDVFWKVWLLIYFEEGEMLKDERRKCNEIWNSILGFAALYAVWILVVHPLVSAEYLGWTCLREGKTRSAIEQLAKDLEFPLGEIYTTKHNSGNSADDTQTSGWLHRRNIVIQESRLQRCNTEEIVALIAAEMGSWKNNSFVKVGMKFLKYGMILIPVWSFHSNWQYIVKDFGLEKVHLSTSRRRGERFMQPHPFFVVVLMLGGAPDPVFRVGTIIMNSISRKLDFKADAFAVKRGYGKQLAKGMLTSGEVEAFDCHFVVDSFYSLFYHDADVLPSILKEYGWTGDEDVGDDEEKVYEHWESGVSLKEGVYWKTDGIMTEQL